MLLLVHLAYWYNAPYREAGTRLSSGQLQLRLDPNRASAAELELLPRIGPAIARQIVAYRESVRDGPAFRASEDLDGVKYVGPATVEQLRPFLRFPGTRDEPAGQHASP